MILYLIPFNAITVTITISSIVQSLVLFDCVMKVRDISGSFRWAPFLALQKSNSFLTMLLLLSKYRMKSVPVVDPGERTIDNVITQSAVIHMLEECAGLYWFESWGKKKLFEIGLPLMKPSRVVKVCKFFLVMLYSCLPSCTRTHRLLNWIQSLDTTPDKTSYIRATLFRLHRK